MKSYLALGLILQVCNQLVGMEQRSFTSVSLPELQAIKVVGCCCLVLAEKAQVTIAQQHQCIQDANRCKERLSGSPICWLCSCFDEKHGAQE